MWGQQQPSATWGGGPQQPQQQPSSAFGNQPGGAQPSGAYPPQQGGYPGGQPGGPQGGPQGYPPAGPNMCCPATAADPCCPDPQPGQPPSITATCTNYCDSAVWCVFFWLIFTITAFGLVVGINARDNLVGKLGIEPKSSEGVQAFTYWMRATKDRTNHSYVPPSTETNAPSAAEADTPVPPTPVPPAVTCPTYTCTCPGGVEGNLTVNTTTSDGHMMMVQQYGSAADDQEGAATLPPKEVETCASESHKLVGTYGATLCMDKTLDGVPVLMNLSRWIIFRNTLYFIAMMGTLVAAVMACIIPNAKTKAAQEAAMSGANANAGYGYMAPQPTLFNGTPLYHVLRAVWFGISWIIFWWICTEMYQYWWFIGYYKNHTSGIYQNFWDYFDRKYVPSVVLVAIYLCWPLCNLLLEVTLFPFMFLIYGAVRQIGYPEIEVTQTVRDMDLHDRPICMRMEMHFCECQQARRLGFSTKLWEMITGDRKQYFEEQPMVGGYPGQPQTTGGYAGNTQAPPAPGTMGGQQQHPPAPVAQPTPQAPAPAPGPTTQPSQSFGRVESGVNQSWAMNSSSFAVNESTASMSPSKSKKKKSKHKSGDDSDAESVSKSKSKKKKSKA